KPKSWGRSTGSYRSDGEQRSNIRLGTKAGLYTWGDKGRLCALVHAQLVRVQHADTAPGAGESE
ncbi:hypothetical protein POSPLADRAFT_1105812, partial [Postia placenta MAD-698-R-SB12]